MTSTSRSSPKTRSELGAAGEAAAAAWYRARGYTVVVRNWRCRHGEIDLVCRRRGVLVFVEVKTRRSDAFGGPAEAVTTAKAARLRGLALRFLDEHPKLRGASLRFDVVAARPAGDGIDLDIIEAAF